MRKVRQLEAEQLQMQQARDAELAAKEVYSSSSSSHSQASSHTLTPLSLSLRPR